MTRLLTANHEMASRLYYLKDALGAKMTRLSSPPNQPIAANPPNPATTTSCTSDPSAASEVGPTPGGRLWSTYSGYTLSDLPTVSLISLPLFAGQLRDGYDYYTSSFAQKVGGELADVMYGRSTKTLDGILGLPDAAEPWLGVLSKGVETASKKASR